MNLFVWQVLEDGQWGTIAAAIPGMPGLSPLITRSARSAELLGLLAVAHHDRTGLPVRKVRFELAEVLREIP